MAKIKVIESLRSTNRTTIRHKGLKFSCCACKWDKVPLTPLIIYREIFSVEYAYLFSH